MKDYQDKLPRTAHMFSMSAAHLNSSMNPLLYAIYNPPFQKGYKLFLRKLFCKKSLNENISSGTRGGTGKCDTRTGSNVKTLESQA